MSVFFSHKLTQFGATSAPALLPGTEKSEEKHAEKVNERSEADAIGFFFGFVFFCFFLPGSAWWKNDIVYHRIECDRYVDRDESQRLVQLVGAA